MDYSFKKSPVATDKLDNEIRASAITVAMDGGCTLLGTDQLTVHFKLPLSDAEVTILNGIVAAHDGVAIVYPIPVREVITQEEKNDKTLKLATGIASFDSTTHLAVCEIKVPGTFGGFDYASDGRFVAGGYAFSDLGKLGDRLTKVEVVDKDNLLGYGAGATIKCYHDQDVAEPNAGWYMYPAPQNSYEVEIDPIGGYGKIPAGLYLRITFLKLSDSPATQVATNIWWAKLE